MVGNLCFLLLTYSYSQAPHSLKLGHLSSSFFGYLGYDEVCCIAGEAINPAQNLPRAVIGTLVIVAAIYMLAALALTGMQQYEDISPTSAFPQAFEANDWHLAAQITAAGELITLPVVVLISLLAQPRLTLSMAHDGLLPARIFASLDSRGNLFGGIIVNGLVMTVVSAFVQFTYLDDLISAGILVAFCITNSSLVLLRCEAPSQQPKLVERCLIAFNASCLATAILWSHGEWFGNWRALHGILAILATFSTFASFATMVSKCPRSAHFGGSIWKPADNGVSADEQWGANNPTAAYSDASSDDGTDRQESKFTYFSTPFVPYLPCLGMAINWYLVAQLDVWGIFLLLLYISVTVVVYLSACARHSTGHLNNWSGGRPQRGYYDTVATHAVDNEAEEEESSIALVPLRRSQQDDLDGNQKLLVQTNSPEADSSGHTAQNQPVSKIGHR